MHPEPEYAPLRARNSDPGAWMRGFCPPRHPLANLAARRAPDLHIDRSRPAASIEIAHPAERRRGLRSPDRADGYSVAGAFACLASFRRCHQASIFGRWLNAQAMATRITKL